MNYGEFELQASSMNSTSRLVQFLHITEIFFPDCPIFKLHYNTLYVNLCFERIINNRPHILKQPKVHDASQTISQFTLSNVVETWQGI